MPSPTPAESVIVLRAGAYYDSSATDSAYTRLDVNTLHRDQEHKELGLNEIGRVQLRTTVPLLCDPYSKNRTTGSFILIDEATGVTVGAGMINSGS